MKKLILRAVPQADGPDGTLQDEALMAVCRVGVTDGHDYPRLPHAFAAPTLAAMQAYGAYIVGWGKGSGAYLGHYPGPRPPVWGLGDTGLYRSLALRAESYHALREAMKYGQSGLSALTMFYDLNLVKAWANDGLRAVLLTFSFMREDETGTGLFHSPFIEAAAWAANGFEDVPSPDFNRLEPLEGLVFEYNGGGVRAVGKVSI
jgi:hypothetical protein